MVLMLGLKVHEVGLCCFRGAVTRLATSFLRPRDKHQSMRGSLTGIWVEDHTRVAIVFRNICEFAPHVR